MGLFNNKKYVCSRCKKEISKGRSRKYCGETYCIECANYISINIVTKTTDEQIARAKSEAEKSKFYYNVNDPFEAYMFWNSEVDRLHKQEKYCGIEWDQKFKDYKIAKIIFVKSTPDYEYPNDPMWDWDTNICIYYNEKSDTYKFTLTESYNSEWDGFPVFQGGEISLELFETYMNIIVNHDYDDLIVKLKNYQQ